MSNLGGFSWNFSFDKQLKKLKHHICNTNLIELLFYETDNFYEQLPHISLSHDSLYALCFRTLFVPVPQLIYFSMFIFQFGLAIIYFAGLGYDWLLIAIIGSAGQLIRNAVDMTSSILEKLQLPMHHMSDLFNELDQFAIQISRRPLYLKAGGLFNLDLTLLSSILTIVTTYLLILCQIIPLNKSFEFKYKAWVISTALRIHRLKLKIKIL